MPKGRPSSAEQTARYLAGEGTMARWWRPDQGSRALRLHFARQVEFVLDALDWRDKLVLDAGCGQGRLLRGLAQRGARVWGVDLSRDMLELARGQAPSQEGTGVELLLGDLTSLPLPSDSFDAAVCLEAFQHLPEPRRALAELSRVTRRGGAVILGFDNSFSLMAVSERLQAVQTALYQRLVLRRRLPRTHWWHSPRAVKGMLRGSGLKLVRAFGIGLAHPEVFLRMGPRVRVPLILGFLSEWVFRHLETRYSLGRTFLRNGMKAVLFVAEKT